MRKSLRKQLLLSHLLLVGLLLGVCLIGVAGFFRLGRSVDRILEDNYKSVVAAQNMKEALERLDSAATFFLAGQKEPARRQYRENLPLFESAYHVEATNITEVGEQNISDDLGARFSAYRADLNRLLNSEPPMNAGQARGLYFSSLQPQFVGVKQRVQDVLDLNQAAILRADERAKEEARRAAAVSVGITAAAALLGAALAWRNVSAITPLMSLTRQAEEVGAGHLNQRIVVRRDDEIGLLARTFNEMSNRLRESRRVEEERLHRAESMSATALADLYDPVVVTDAEGRVVHLNRAAEGLFGPAARVRGQWVRAVVRDGRLADAIQNAAREARVSAEEGEAALVTLAGRTYRLRATPMRDTTSGAPLGAVAVLEDVSYEQQVDRLKTEFIGVASHELRTPVTSLLLGIGLLEEGAVGELTTPQQEVVGALRADLLRLERMMHDLLELTRLEAGATPPRFQVVPPAELLETARRAVEVQATAKGVSLRVDPLDPIPAVRADRGQIGRVLVNLLTNAIRHTPSGGEVRLGADHAAGRDAVTFSVADTGVGIPPAYLGRIFERFVQVPGATRGGAGLGLSIAQTVVRSHGGDIHARSTVGAGSTFEFTLPVAEMEDAATGCSVGAKE